MEAPLTVEERLAYLEGYHDGYFASSKFQFAKASLPSTRLPWANGLQFPNRMVPGDDQEETGPGKIPDRSEDEPMGRT